MRSVSFRAVNILRTDTPGELAAEIVANRLRAFPDLRLALPTGNTPQSMYRHLRQLNLNPRQASLFQIDEYLGASRGRMREELLRSIQGIPFGETVFWDTKKEILPGAPLALDLVVLGLGRNGHIAFVEPDSPERDFYRGALSADTARVNHVPRQDVLTIGVSYIMRSREVVLLVSGKGKAEILARALQGPVTRSVPASLLQDHKRLLVVCDREAASALRGLPALCGKAIVAVGCRDKEGGYSPASRGRLLRAARLATGADLVVLSGGPLRGRETEAEHMMWDFPSRVDVPLLAEEASDRSAHHIYQTAPLLRAAGIRETIFVTSWWHMPRFWIQNRSRGIRFRSAWDMRGMWGQRRLRDEIGALVWARADGREARKHLLAKKSEDSLKDIWVLSGEGQLQDLSGSYTLADARAVTALALERAPSSFDFDQLLSGRSPSGDLLSGNQLLAALHS